MTIRTRLERLEAKRPMNPYADMSDAEMNARIRYLIGRRINRDITDMPDDEFHQLCDQTHQELKYEIHQSAR